MSVRPSPAPAIVRPYPGPCQKCGGTREQNDYGYAWCTRCWWWRIA